MFSEQHQEAKEKRLPMILPIGDNITSLASCMAATA